ncbi:SGNH/GDSL hydrolase family protein [Metabacillus herbersteinensis]|uniref:SGNH/GDSL hydrolase family protein n=1 Tax=Metabacillus herbersteinensis TaxID=283816 RepID=A0ABV6GH46_9BACI
MRVLFIGDSITDCGRREDEEKIGSGYVRVIHDYLKTTNPKQSYEVINRGIGGNRVTDLEARWQEDVIELSPDFVSISIGINDVWRQLDNQGDEQVYPDQFEQVYTKLLTQVKEETNAKIILMEPTIIEEDIKAVGNKKLKAYVEIVQTLAKRFDATLVPTHQAFLDYLKANNSYKLTTDGVHMNTAGNMLMAITWLRNVELGTKVMVN